jgi:DNA-binding response OmpR family regulator
MASILIVDDEEAVLQMVGRILEKAGFEVTAVQSGEAAMARIEAQEFDALLTDVVMPGMSGIDLVLEVRRKCPGLPVCCMTGYVETRPPLFDQIPVINKPFDPRELVETVRTMTGQPAVPPPATPHRAIPLAEWRDHMERTKAAFLRAKSEVLEIAAEGLDAIPHPDRFVRLERARREETEAFAKYQRAVACYQNAVRKGARSEPEGSAESPDRSK